jgi:hypothetical protein
MPEDTRTGMKSLFGSPVRRAVVDHDDLAGHAGSFESSGDTEHLRSDARFFVKGRHDNGYGLLRPGDKILGGTVKRQHSL